VHVCPLSAITGLIAATGARHLVTVINQQTMPETPAGLHPDNHLRLAINDITEPQEGLVHPREDHIAELVRFARGWNRRGPLVVHCWAGISRSTAAAYIVLCALNSEGNEQRIAELLRAASPTATPNSLMIEIADEALRRRGRMIEAIEAIGRGELAVEGVPFSLPSRIS
jgi:predicted protein tyrosine phosphatase